MIGHVYAKFSEEEEAADALNVMNGRYFDGRRMEVEFSPVTDFREASKWSSVVLYLWKLIVTMISRLFEQNCVDSIVTHMFSYCVNSCKTSFALGGSGCRDFDEDTCRRGGFCNFMHVKPVPLCLIRDMEEDAEDERRRDEDERRRKEERRSRRDRKDGHRHRSGRRERKRSRSLSRSRSRE